MNTKTKPYCIACNRPIGESDHRVKRGDDFGLCLACFEKVERGGRSPWHTIEAVLYYFNDPDVGGPDDSLDHEDYRDLQLLGLWPEGGNEHENA